MGFNAGDGECFALLLEVIAKALEARNEIERAKLAEMRAARYLANDDAASGGGGPAFEVAWHAADRLTAEQLGEGKGDE